jgi:predicted amidophosphoribosyltransferase
MDQVCPTCRKSVKANPRYPHYLCRPCVERATDANGKRIQFFQANPNGRYAARYADTGIEYPSHECFVDGVKCWADEARFGGIVVQSV